MNNLRRKLVGVAAVLLLKPFAALAAAWNKDAFGAKTPQDALKGIGAGSPAPSKDLMIEAPQIAENGAVVPIEVSSAIAGTTAIAVIIEKNPFPYTGTFDVSQGAVPYVHLRVKIGESSHVRVVVAAGGKHYMTAKEVKVTIGGCGG